MYNTQLDQLRDDFEIKSDVNEGCGYSFFVKLLFLILILFIGSMTMYFIPSPRFVSVGVFLFLFFIFQPFLQNHIMKLNPLWAKKTDVVEGLFLSTESI